MEPVLWQTRSWKFSFLVSVGVDIMKIDRPGISNIITLLSGQQLCYTIWLAENVRMRRNDRALLSGNARSLRNNSASNLKHRSVLRTRRTSNSNSNKWLRLQWLHARPTKPTIISALKSYFYFVKKQKAFTLPWP